MKKILAAVTAGALCMALVGCGGIFLTKSDKEKFYVTDPSLPSRRKKWKMEEEDLISTILIPNILKERLEEAIQENRMISGGGILRRSGGSASGARWRT